MVGFAAYRGTVTGLVRRARPRAREGDLPRSADGALERRAVYSNGAIFSTDRVSRNHHGHANRFPAVLWRTARLNTSQRQVASASLFYANAVTAMMVGRPGFVRAMPPRYSA